MREMADLELRSRYRGQNPIHDEEILILVSGGIPYREIERITGASRRRIRELAGPSGFTPNFGQWGVQDARDRRASIEASQTMKQKISELKVIRRNLSHLHKGVPAILTVRNQVDARVEAYRAYLLGRADYTRRNDPVLIENIRRYTEQYRQNLERLIFGVQGSE